MISHDIFSSSYSNFNFSYSDLFLISHSDFPISHSDSRLLNTFGFGSSSKSRTTGLWNPEYHKLVILKEYYGPQYRRPS